MWPNLQKTADLVTFTEEILNAKLHFLCNANTTLKFETQEILKKYMQNFSLVLRVQYARKDFKTISVKLKLCRVQDSLKTNKFHWPP